MQRQQARAAERGPGNPGLERYRGGHGRGGPDARQKCAEPALAHKAVLFQKPAQDLDALHGIVKLEQLLFGGQGNRKELREP